MAMNPYAPCPCGSGKKFKWCCQKIAGDMQKVLRLWENGQHDAAFQALDHALHKAPTNAWLLITKAQFLADQGQLDAAEALAEKAVSYRGDYLAAHILLVRLALARQGPAPAALRLQQLLEVCPAEQRPEVAGLVAQLAGAFERTGQVLACKKHIEILRQFSPANRPDLKTLEDETLAGVDRASEWAPWLKEDYALLAEDQGGDPALFTEAMELAGQYLDRRAAERFETLSRSRPDSAALWFNLGLTRAWVGEDRGAAEPFGRAARLQTDPERAVDWALLALSFQPLDAGPQLERVEWQWTVRDEAGLVSGLLGDPCVIETDLEHDDDQPPREREFLLLDRPKPEGGDPSHLTIEDVPRVLANIALYDMHGDDDGTEAAAGQREVSLELVEDERAEATRARFLGLVEPFIEPDARRDVIEAVPVANHRMSWTWFLPPALSPPDSHRLTETKRAEVVNHAWPDTPEPILDGKTPREAAALPEHRAALRALFIHLEHGLERQGSWFDVGRLRQALGVPPEPAPDPATVDIDALPLHRLRNVPAEHLDDDRLIRLHERAFRYSLMTPIANAARALIERPQLKQRGVSFPDLFQQLVLLALRAYDPERVYTWIDRGRQFDVEQLQVHDRPLWDCLELQARSMFEPPTEWVPFLADLFDRFGKDKEATDRLMRTLLAMGLLRVIRNPDDPEQLTVDASLLEAILGRFGPRAVPGGLDVGVTQRRGGSRSGLWTPGQERGGQAIWVPDADAQPAREGEPPKIWTPGS